MYIDESGDLGFTQNSSPYLVITALLVKDPAPLERIVKNMRRNKFSKKLKVFNELKANRLPKEITMCALKKLSEVETQIFHIVLEKEKIKSDFLLGNKHKLYNFVAGHLAKKILLEQIDVEVRIDRSKGKQALRDDFDEYFERCLREKSSVRKITIQHSHSHGWVGLQFADLLAWSAFQKVNHKKSEFVDIIPNQEVVFLW